MKYISHRNVVGEKHFKIFPSRKDFFFIMAAKFNEYFLEGLLELDSVVLWFVLVRAGLGQLLFQNLLDTTPGSKRTWDTCLCSLYSALKMTNKLVSCLSEHADQLSHAATMRYNLPYVSMGQEDTGTRMSQWCSLVVGLSA